MKFIDDVIIHRKRVLLRVDFNVPLKEDGSIADDLRIRETIPTIKYLLDRQNKVIIVSHLGRPTLLPIKQGFAGQADKRNSQHSLEKVAHRVHSYLPDYHWHFVPDFLTDHHLLEQVKIGEFAILENIRFYSGEADNDAGLAKRLASLADVYVNDAFAVSHREAASIVAINKYLPAYGGFLLRKEIDMLNKLIKKPKKPFVAIIGGKKISTKIKFLSKLTRLADYVLLSGGLSNTFLLARGIQIGKSLFIRRELGQVNYLTAIAKRNGTKILLPEDAIAGPDPDGEKSLVKLVNSLGKGDQILDIGPKTQAEYEAVINRAKTIVWNGPLGHFENPQFRRGTDFIYYAIALNKQAFSVIGGGDTLAAIAGNKNLENITHISTGGGAMLEYIENGTLVGLEALKKNNKSIKRKFL